MPFMMSGYTRLEETKLSYQWTLHNVNLMCTQLKGPIESCAFKSNTKYIAQVESQSVLRHPAVRKSGTGFRVAPCISVTGGSQTFSLGNSLVQTGLRSSHTQQVQAGDTEWSLVFHVVQNEISVTLNLQAVPQQSPMMKVWARVKVSILSQALEEKYFKEETNIKCLSPGSGIHLDKFIQTEDLLSEANGYVCNDMLILQCIATIFCQTGTSGPIESKNLRALCALPDNLHENLGKLLESQQLTDFTIRAGDKELKVHKAIIAAQSPFFMTMFQTDMKEAQKGTMEIESTTFDPQVVEEMVTYLYTGKVPNMESMAKDVYAIAHMYQISHLKHLAEQQLANTLTMENIIETLILAERLEGDQLRGACLEYINHNADQFTGLEGWMAKLQAGTNQPCLLVAQMFKKHVEN